MKLAVIGTGNMGKSIGGWAAAVGYEVTFASTSLEKARNAASETGNGARAASVREAVADADMVLLAIYLPSAADVIREAGDAIRGKVLIDPMNEVSDDMNSLKLGADTSTTEELARLAPEARVVKAFNTVFAGILKARDPKINGQPVTVLIAGDDEAAKRQVQELIAKFGFDVIDAGPARMARVIDAIGLMNLWLGFGRGLGTGIAFSLLRGK